MPRQLIDYYSIDNHLAHPAGGDLPMGEVAEDTARSVSALPVSPKEQEPIRATIVGCASKAGLAVVYEISNGTKYARLIGPDDWPLIGRLHYGGRLVFATPALRNRYLEAKRVV